MTLNKESKGTFTNDLWFRFGKIFTDCLIRAKSTKPEENERCKPCGKKPCLVCNSSSTTTIFTTETSQGSFEFQKDPLNCDSEKVLYSLKCKVSGDVH